MADKIVKDLSDNFLNCCICMSPFKTPKMLPCIHSFCTECLVKYAKTQKGNDIACPTCRKVCTLPESGVKGLQTNFHLVNLAEKVTLLEKLTSSKKRTNLCDSCKNKEVAAFCFDCNFAICSKCKDQHTLFPVLRSHTVVPTEEIADPKFQTGWRNATSPYCDLHSSEKLNFYCKTCSKLICRDCTIVMHAKPGHEFTDVATQVNTVKEALTAMLDISNKNLTKGLDFIQRGKDGSKTIKKTSEGLKKDIAAHCLKRVAETKKILIDQKASLLRHVSDEETEKVENILTRLQSADDWVGRMRNAQNLTQHVIEENNPWELLGMSADIIKAFETLQIESEELDWCDSYLTQQIVFTSGQIPDIQLGYCDHLSEAVTTDPYGNFILCHFNLSSKMLYIRVLMKESNYSKVERFPPHPWKHEIPDNAKLNVTARRSDFLYVELGKVIAIFNCKSKECSNEKTIFKQSKPNELVSSIEYCPSTGQMCTCVNKNKFDWWDKDFNNPQKGYTLQSNAMYMFPSRYDVLFGCEQGDLMKYSVEKQTWSTLTLPPPPEFKDGQIIFYEGLRKGSFQCGQRYHQGRYVTNMTDEFVCFLVWVHYKIDAKSNKKSKRWILKEYCTQTKKFLGVLEDVPEDEMKIPAALYCKEVGNGGMEIYLCDNQGKVESYKRDRNQGNPALYKKMLP
ncbi:E3 ubiquitin-protein ligase TRIM56 [Holothuria leucospilota]|uniref:E3 ubiquitin-protein ligase TRIM56 n=1 Tax=Holothuria leucospilota TaxID=206669 RepID=A0A9Q1BUC9_HOLLE|nr:E3 ubiquitin-protein ligase TRIM56 [Holothuria leucospilota]